MRPESMHPGHRLSRRAVAVLALVPLIAVAMLLGVVSGNGKAVHAAVVNLDEPVTIRDRTVPLGRQLAAEILAREGENITWTLADEADAKAGLGDGRYSAVVTIPKEFSEAATSYSSNDAEAAKQAQVQVTVSKNSSVGDAALAQEIATMAKHTLNATLTKTYLDNVYVGFNTVGEQFKQVIDGVKQLDDGGAKLSEGVGQATTGSGQLAQGLGILAGRGGDLTTGANKLADGAGQLSTGAGTLADGAGQLGNGAGQLADGGSTLANGAGQLATGAHGAADGASQLQTGAGTLANGAGTLSEGAGKLATGAGTLNGGLAEFDKGIQQLNDKAPKLAKGVDDLATGSEKVLGAIPGYTDGAGAAVDGIGKLRDGLVQLDDSLKGKLDPKSIKQLQGSLDELVPALKEARAALKAYFPDRDPATVKYEELEAAAGSLDKQLTQVENTVDKLADGTAEPSPEVQAVVKKIIADWKCPVTDPATCEQLGKAYAQGVADGVGKGIQYGAGQVRERLATKDPRTGQTPFEAARAFAKLGLKIAKPAIDIRDLFTSKTPAGTDPLDALQKLPTTIGEQVGGLSEAVGKLRSGADELATKAEPLKKNGPALSEGATKLLDGVKTLNAEVAALPGGTKKLADASTKLVGGASELSTGAGALADGAGQLSGGASRLSTGAGSLAEGAGQLATGADRLATGAGSLADGAGQLSTGANRLSGGANRLSDGASQLATGAGTLADGTGQYVDGIGQAAEGATTLNDGLIQLGDGASKLAGGVGTLHDELAAGYDKLPTYSETDRDTLSTVVASPIQQDNQLSRPAMVPIASLLAVAALWLGAVLAYVFAAPVPSDLVTNGRPSPALWARTLGLPLALGAGQGAVIGLAASWVLGAPAGRTLGAIGLLVLLGGSFVLINHALSAWLGNIGRGIAVLLLVLTVGLGLTSTVPGWGAAIAGFSPLHNGLQLIRTWLAQGSGMVAIGSAALLFGVIAIVLSYAAIATKRRLSPDQFRSRIAEG